MKVSLFLLLLLIPFYPAVSQKSEIMQDPTAEPFLDDLAKFFNPEKTIQIEFKYEVESLKDSSITSDFGYVIIKGPKYKLKLEDGEMYYNGQKLWVYNINAEEVYSSIPKETNKDQMILDPFRLLSKYKDYYKYRKKNDVEISGKSYINLELYPIKLETNYSVLKIVLDKDTHQMFSLELQQKNGIIYRIYIKEFIEMLKIDDSAFSWDASLHPDVLEVEM